jgi:hypothetical protein
MVEGEKVSLKEMVAYIGDWRRYILKSGIFIVLFSLIGLGLGIFYASYKRPDYVASTIFVLGENESAAGGFAQYAGLASMVGIDMGASGGGIFQGDNILELYKSRSMIKKTLLSPVIIAGKRQLIIDRYVEVNGLRKKWTADAILKNISFDSKGPLTRVQDSIISDIASNINKNMLNVGKPDKKLSIIKVDVVSKDELFSKVFNDQIVKNVNDFYVQTKTKKSMDNLAILQTQTDSIRRALNQAISNVAISMDFNPNANQARQVLKVPSQRRQVDAEANKAILSELVKNLEISKVSLRKETPLIQLIDAPVYPLEKKSTGKITGGLTGFFIGLLLCLGFLSIKFVFKSLMQ